MKRVCLLILSLAMVALSVTPQPAQADQIIITADVPVRPSNLHINLSASPSGPKISSNQIIQFSLSYGSYISQPIGQLVVKVHWQQTAGQPPLVTAIKDSVSNALNNTPPIIDLKNQTITWNISPLPQHADQTVYWQMVLINPTSNSNHSFTISSSLTGPGVQVFAPAQSFSFATNLKPPTSPTPLPTSKPSPTPIKEVVTPTATSSPTPPASSQVSPTPSAPTPSTSPVPIDTPSGNQIIRDWLAMLAIALAALFAAWTIRHQLINRLWLIWSKKTTVHGRVRDQQLQPLKEIKLTVQSLTSSAKSHTIQTNQQGQHYIVLPPGEYQFTILDDQDQVPPINQTLLTIDQKQRGQSIKHDITLDQPND